MMVSTRRVCTTQIRHHHCLALCPCCACFPKNMMRMCQYFPNPVPWTYLLNAVVTLWCPPKFLLQKSLNIKGVPRSAPVFTPCSFLSQACLSPLHICGLGLFPFSGLVCDLRLSRSRKELSPKAHYQRVSCLITTWRTLTWLGAFPIQVLGHHSLGAMVLGV